MALVTLQTENFRNLVADSHQFSPSVNLVYGANGSGKTSLLESIGYLGLGRSFRQNRHQSVCGHGTDRFVVFGKLISDIHDLRVMEHRLGFSRSIVDKETRLRVDGETVASLSSLAALFPVSVIDPGVFDIVAGGPGKRRQFLDWLVFHVEPSFGPLWLQCQRVISQRNQMLRSGRLDSQQIKVWDRQFVILAEKVNLHRQTVFDRFKIEIRALLEEIPTLWSEPVSFGYFPGWDSNKSLPEILALHSAQEQKVGYTMYGPNRCDIRVKYHNRNVAETFSRGQQKTLVILMKLAQARVLRKEGKQITFLLDDINAELDGVHRALLAEQLQALGSQVFLTTIERPEPDQLWQKTLPDYRMFHVEHGRLTEE